jgi:nucleotide-binding universal stress UspA family protein
MTSRILVPVDEKLGAVRTVNYLIKLKDTIKPVINLVTVYDMSIIEGHGLVEEVQEKIEKVAKVKSEKIIKEFQDKFEKEGIYVENSIVAKGNPGEIICEQAERLGVDIIAMSPNNQSEIMNVIVGSVTHYVIHHSVVSILLVK